MNHHRPPERVAEAARTLQLVSDPTRLRVLLAISECEGDCTLQHIAARLSGLDRRVLRDHIRALRDGWLISPAEGHSRAKLTLTRAGKQAVEAYTVLSQQRGATPLDHLAAGESEPSNIQQVVGLLRRAMHPLRLSILELLAEKQRTCQEIVAELSTVRSNSVSSQLGILRRGGIVMPAPFGPQRLTTRGEVLVRLVRATCDRLDGREGQHCLTHEPVSRGMDGALNPLSPEGMACLLKAFAQPLRLRILNLLVYRREICSCHLAGALHVPNNAVLDSLRHPKKLSLIHARRDGGWVIYSLAPTAAALFQSLHECLPVQGGMLAIFREDREKLDALPPCTPLALPTLHRSTARPNRRLA